MTSEESKSVTRWIDALKAGDREAATPLWDRYFHRLVQLANARLGTRHGHSDEEDVALSAFHSLCRGAARGHFPKLNDRDDLWRLLVVITARKAQAQVRREGRKKRGSGQVRAEVDLAANDPGDGDARLDQIIGREPTPEFAVMVAEQYQRVIESLGDESLRRVACLKMEGYTNDEIAAQLGCARRTVARRLELIRKTWLGEEP